MRRLNIIVALSLLVIFSFSIRPIKTGHGAVYSGSQTLTMDSESADNTTGNGSNSTVVYVDPQNITAFPGETFVINVKVANVTNLYGLDIRFSWNPTIIKYVNHTVTMPMEENPGGILHKPIQLIKNEVNESGIEPELLYWVACASINPASYFNGSGTVFTMTFEVIKTGACNLHFTRVQLAGCVRGRGAICVPIPHSVKDGRFESLLSEHDVGAFVEAPLHVKPGTAVHLRVGAVNSDLFDESDVRVDLWIDGELVETFAIVLLEVNASSIQTHLWTPTAEALHNITVHVLKVQYETNFRDNVKTVEILVSNVIEVPLHSTTIQEAIDMASPGATISVSPGTYYERLVIDKTVTLIGAGNATIIDGQESVNVVKITADNVVFSGFTIRNGFLRGVYIFRGNNVTVTNSYISDVQGSSNTGIHIYGSENNSILFNAISDIDRGLSLGNFDDITYNNRVVGNTISGCNTAIEARMSVNSNIYHNNFINNTVQLSNLNSNIWHNNENEGNYWSDYTGVDLDGDGVGDTLLPHQGVDYYPLTETITPILPEFPPITALLILVGIASVSLIYGRKHLKC